MNKGFPDGSDGKECACNAGDVGLIPGLGGSPGEGMATHFSILAWTDQGSLKLESGFQFRRIQAMNVEDVEDWYHVGKKNTNSREKTFPGKCFH